MYKNVTFSFPFNFYFFTFNLLHPLICGYLGLYSIRGFLPMTFFELHSLEWLKLTHNDLTHLSEDTVQPILDTLTMIDLSSESWELEQMRQDPEIR